MRLTVRWWAHGKTSTNRCGLGGQGPTGGRPSPRHPAVAHGTSRAVAQPGPTHPRTNRHGFGRQPGHRRPVADALSPARRTRRWAHGSVLGWPAPCLAEHRRGSRLPGGVESPGRARRVGGPHAPASRPGATGRSPGEALGGVSPGPAAPLAQSGSRHAPPQGRCAGARDVEKKRCPKSWRPC